MHRDAKSRVLRQTSASERRFARFCTSDTHHKSLFRPSSAARTMSGDFALADPLQEWRMAVMTAFRRFVLFAFASVSLLSLVRPAPLAAQGGGATGTIAGRVVDDNGAGVSGAQIFINQPALSAQTRNNGDYVLNRVPAGTYMVHVRELGFRPDSASVTVSAG